MLWASNTVLGECQMKDKFPEQLHPHEKKKKHMYACRRERIKIHIFVSKLLHNSGALVANHAYN